MAKGVTLSPTATTDASSTDRKKLHGRAFYESIGSPKVVLAPMVDQSEFVGFPNFASRRMHLTYA
jgi:hypothetical protein